MHVRASLNNALLERCKSQQVGSLLTPLRVLLVSYLEYVGCGAWTHLHIAGDILVIAMCGRH